MVQFPWRDLAAVSFHQLIDEMVEMQRLSSEVMACDREMSRRVVDA